MIQKIAYTLISIFIYTISTYAQQESQEDLTQLDFKELYAQFKKNYADSTKAVKYLEAYSLKAKKEKDTNYIAKGYYFKTFLYDSYHTQLNLYDSILALEKSVKDKDVIFIAYHDIGIIHQDKFQYDKALTNYLTALEYLKKNKNPYLKFNIDLEVSNIKMRIEQNEEALHILKKSFKKAQENNYKEKDPYIYNATLLALSNAYRKLHHIDSAQMYIKMGLQENKEKNEDLHFRFLLLEGLIELSNTYSPTTFSKLEKAITYLDSINTSTSINENVNISLAYYHMGKAHKKHANYDKAITSFHKMDIAIGNSPDILPEAIDGYNYLKNHYEELGDTEKGLEYANKMIAFNKILNTQYKSIDQEIKREFDIPSAIEEQKGISKELNDKNEKYILLVRILISIGVLGILFLIVQLVQKNKYKQRFKKLQEETTSKSIKKEHTPSNEKPNIPEEIIRKVATCLEAFEKENQFLDKAINYTKLAKNIGTNGPYFSKAFKYLKNESFTMYLRNIRLDYAIERLREDKTFRKYTIKTIALDSGFSNPESFSKYFYKKYKMYPSFFIRQIEREKNTNI